MIISTSHPSHFSSLRLTSDLVLSLHVRRQTLDGLFGETGLNCVSVELLGSASKRTAGINENLGFFVPKLIFYILDGLGQSNYSIFKVGVRLNCASLVRRMELFLTIQISMIAFGRWVSATLTSHFHFCCETLSQSAADECCLFIL